LNGGCDIWNTVPAHFGSTTGHATSLPLPDDLPELPDYSGVFSHAWECFGRNDGLCGTTGGNSNAYVNYSFAVTGCSISATTELHGVASAAGSVTLSNSAGVSGATGCSALGTQVGPDMFSSTRRCFAGDSYILTDASAKLHAQWRYSEGPWVWWKARPIAGKCGLYPTTYCTGHFGRLQWPRGRQKWHAPFTSLNSAANIFAAGIDICDDDHFSWNHVDTTPGRRLPGND